MAYFLCKLLAPRPTFAQDMTEAEAALMGRHAAYWKGLLDPGKAIAFGPVLDPVGSWGLCIVQVQDEAEARSLTGGDPVIQFGKGFSYEFFPMPSVVTQRSLPSQSSEAAEHPTRANGKICYIEIPAVDIQGSASFYNKAFGWRIRQDGGGHVAFDDTVGEVSGMWVAGRRAATEPGLLVSIMVDDIAVSIEAIIKHGGKIVQPVGMDAPEITARFSDPVGNVIGLYQESR